jgi:hypothetical protein
MDLHSLELSLDRAMVTMHDATENKIHRDYFGRFLQCDESIVPDHDLVMEECPFPSFFWAFVEFFLKNKRTGTIN